MDTSQEQAIAFERLSAAEPARTGAPLTEASLNHMIQAAYRGAATARREPASDASRSHAAVLRAWQAKVVVGATAIAAAAAIAFSLVGTSGPAPSLAFKVPHSLTLSVGSTRGLYPTRAGGKGHLGVGVGYGPFVLLYQFKIGADFSDVPPSQFSYPAVGPSDPGSQLQTWAAQIGVPGAVVPDATAASWSVGSDANLRDVSIVTLGKDRSGILQFAYRTGDEDSMFDACTPSSPPNLGPVYSDQSAMVSSAKSFIASRGLSYTLGSPHLETGWPSPTYDGCGAMELMSQQILIDGVPTDQSVSFDFNSSGHVVDAYVPVFTVGQQANYPLVSEAAAATSLVQSTAYLSDPGSGNGVPTTGPDSHLMVIHLHSATVALRTFVTADGSIWFLPVYDFTGDGSLPIMTPNPYPWAGNVLAASPSAVTVPAR